MNPTKTDLRKISGAVGCAAWEVTTKMTISPV
jgi:hypothetical protein